MKYRNQIMSLGGREILGEYVEEEKMIISLVVI